jgi:arsenate reductase
MAEGWARHLAPSWLTVDSAGIEQHGKNPRAIAVMAEAGIDISGQESSKLTDTMLNKADYVVTVCGHADEHCPALPSKVRKEHWPLNDPAKADGDEAAIMAVFRQTRDDIQQRVRELVQRLKEEQS